MNNTIEQQLISLLRPLLNVDLALKPPIEPQGDFATLEIASTSPLGMGSEVAQGTDAQGNQFIYTTYQAEVVVRYFGTSGVQHLSLLATALRRISVSEQFQRANIGIGRLENINSVASVESDENLAANTEFRFFIHYTQVVNDAVGVIEHVTAAHDGGETTIHLTR